MAKVSKLQGYAVTSPGGATVSKLIGYAVVETPTTVRVSQESLEVLKGWSASGGTAMLGTVGSGSTGDAAPLAYVSLTSHTASQAVSLASVSFRATGLLGGGVGVIVRAAVYDDTGSSGAPGALLGQSNAVTGIAAGSNTLTLQSAVSIASGATVWLGIHVSGDNFTLTATATIPNSRFFALASGASLPATAPATNIYSGGRYEIWGEGTGSTAQNPATARVTQASAEALLGTRSVTAASALHLRMKLGADLTENWTGTQPTPPPGWNTKAGTAPGTISNLIDADGVATTVGYQQTEWWDYASDFAPVGSTGLLAEVAYTYMVHDAGSTPVTVAFTNLPDGTYTLRLHATATDYGSVNFTCNGDAETWSPAAYHDWTGLSPSGGVISVQTGLSGGTQAATLTALELIQTDGGGTTETILTPATARLTQASVEVLRTVADNPAVARVDQLSAEVLTSVADYTFDARVAALSAEALLGSVAEGGAGGTTAIIGRTTATGSVAWSADYAGATRFDLNVPVTLTHLKFEALSSAASLSVTGLVYSDAGTSYPVTLLGSTGSASAVSAGTNTLTFDPPLSLPANQSYWLGLQVLGTGFTIGSTVSEGFNVRWADSGAPDSPPASPVAYAHRWQIWAEGEAGVAYVGAAYEDANASWSANTVGVSRYTAASGGTLTTIKFWAAVADGDAFIRGVIYADAGGEPGALLAQTSLGVGAVQKTNSKALTTPLSVSAGQALWIGLHVTDAPFTPSLRWNEGTNRSWSDTGDPSDPAPTGSVASHGYGVWAEGDGVTWAGAARVDQLSVEILRSVADVGGRPPVVCVIT